MSKITMPPPAAPLAPEELTPDSLRPIVIKKEDVTDEMQDELKPLTDASKFEISDAVDDPSMVLVGNVLIRWDDASERLKELITAASKKEEDKPPDDEDSLPGSKFEFEDGQQGDPPANWTPKKSPSIPPDSDLADDTDDESSSDGGRVVGNPAVRPAPVSLATSAKAGGDEVAQKLTEGLVRDPEDIKSRSGLQEKEPVSKTVPTGAKAGGAVAKPKGTPVAGTGSKKASTSPKMSLSVVPNKGGSSAKESVPDELPPGQTSAPPLMMETPVLSPSRTASPPDKPVAAAQPPPPPPSPIPQAPPEEEDVPDETVRLKRVSKQPTQDPGGATDRFVKPSAASPQASPPASPTATNPNPEPNEKDQDTVQDQPRRRNVWKVLALLFGIMVGLAVCALACTGIGTVVFTHRMGQDTEESVDTPVIAQVGQRPPDPEPPPVTNPPAESPAETMALEKVYPSQKKGEKCALVTLLTNNETTAGVEEFTICGRSVASGADGSLTVKGTPVTGTDLLSHVSSQKGALADFTIQGATAHCVRSPQSTCNGN